MTARLRSLATRRGWTWRATLSCLLLLLLLPSHARAQASAAIESLRVDLRPEYDQPAMLVIYWVRLASSTALPATVSLPIPARVGEPYAVGMLVEGSDRPLLAEYTRRVDGDWATITITTETRDVQLEYYDALTFDGDARRYTFTWPGGPSLGAFAYDIQQPFGASDLAARPAGTVEVRADGLTYIHADLGPVSSQTTLTLEMSYVKTTSGLSVEVLQPAAPLTETAGSAPLEAAITGWLPWVLGGLAVVLLVGGGLWFWRFTAQPSTERVRPRRRPPAAEKRPEAEEIDASPVYCHNCGTQAGASDRFCRRCGTRLRQ
ncbi:MAG: zinc ribbon domain-containing protein [Chloroflexota bacterium]